MHVFSLREPFTERVDGLQHPLVVAQRAACWETPRLGAARAGR